MLVMASVRHPRLPFGGLWVPCFSFVVYLAAWGARLVIRFVGRGKLARQLPLTPARLGWLVTRATAVVLWSGSYTLLEVQAPGKVEVRVRLV
jgi:hypothetical protein